MSYVGMLYFMQPCGLTVIEDFIGRTVADKVQCYLELRPEDSNLISMNEFLTSIGAPRTDRTEVTPPPPPYFSNPNSPIYESYVLFGY